LQSILETDESAEAVEVIRSMTEALLWGEQNDAKRRRAKDVGNQRWGGDGIYICLVVWIFFYFSIYWE
jgi:hypothetical protein